MQDSGGLRVCYRLLSVAAHPEIPFPRVRGEVALADGSNLDIVAALDEGEQLKEEGRVALHFQCCLLYTSPSPRDATLSRMPSSA